MLKQNVPADVPLYELSCTLFFICPAVILIFLYVRIGLTIKNNTKLRGNVHGELQSIQSKKSIVSMLSKRNSLPIHITYLSEFALWIVHYCN